MVITVGMRTDQMARGKYKILRYWYTGKYNNKNFNSLFIVRNQGHSLKLINGNLNSLKILVLLGS